jgi:hypothetical protein
MSVKPPELLPGDLVFFSTNGPGATHVGGRQQRLVRPRTQLDRRGPRRAPQRQLLVARFLGARRIG